MTTPRLATAFLLWAAAPALAQAGEPKPAPTPPDATAAYRELARAMNEAISTWREQARQAAETAQAEGRPLPAISMRPPTAAFVARAQALAKQYAGTDAAVQFLAFVCKNATDEGEAVKQALRTLTADHGRSAAVALVLDHLAAAWFQHGAGPEVTALLDVVIADNAAADVKAQALLTRGNLRLQLAETEAQRAAAAADIRRVATITQDADLLQQAKEALFEIEHLQVGCAAPDIVAKDTDGVEFKLSDYRGKVVLLDFWGFW
jgi:hypothetical protein